VARARIGNDAVGFAGLRTLLAEAGDTPEKTDPGGESKPIEGCWCRVAGDRSQDLPDQPAGGIPIPPRRQVSGAKSDAMECGDARRTSCAPTPPRIAPCRQIANWRKRVGACSAPTGRRCGRGQQVGNQVRTLLKDFLPGRVGRLRRTAEGGLARRAPASCSPPHPTPHWRRN